MSRYIDAEKLIEKINSRSTHLLNEWDTLGVLAVIDETPTADVEKVRHARVIEKRCAGFARQFYCSWCGADIRESDADCPYCKVCGANMNGGKK